MPSAQGGESSGTRRVVAVAVCATVAVVVPAFLVGALAVQIGADLHFDTARLGLSIAVFGAAGACTSIPLGRIVENWGSYRSLQVAVAVSSMVMLAIAVLARSWGALTALLAVAGVANALGQPAANAFVARGVPLRRHGWAFGVKQAGLPTATLLAGAAVPAFALTVGWRWAFVAGSAAGAGIVVNVRRADRFATLGGFEPKLTRPALPLVALGVLAVSVGLGAAAASALGNFLVSGSVHAGLSPGAAGWLLAGGSVVAIAARLAVGASADRREGRHLLVVIGLLAGGAVAFVGYAFDEAWLYIAATPVAFGAGWAWPGLFNFAVVRSNPAAPGAATAVTQTGTYLGIVVGPLVFGTLVDAASYTTAWLVTSAWALAGAACMVVGRRLLRRHVPTR